MPSMYLPHFTGKSPVGKGMFALKLLTDENQSVFGWELWFIALQNLFLIAS